MWGLKKTGQDNRGVDGESIGSGLDLSTRRTRLSVMPLTVLLPKLGELSEIAKLAPVFARKIEELDAAAGQEEGPDEESRVSSERAMLSQVMQWLSIGGQDES